MTVTGLAGILAALVFVVAVAAVALRLLRRYVVAPAGSGSVRLEVVQRLGLGPRQGIAVVRIGEKYVAVSVGDGGVRHLLELPAPELTDPARAARSPAAPDFRALLAAGVRRVRGAAGSAAIAVLVAAAIAGTALALSPLGAIAQTSPAVPPAARAATGARAEPAKAATPADTARSVAAAAQVAGRTGAAPAATAIEAIARAAPQLDLRLAGPKGEPNGLHLSGTVGVIVMMGLLTLLPTLLLLMTSFTRILVVLNFLRQAIGAQAVPPAHLVTALALLLTGLVMGPTLAEANRTAFAPWLAGRMDQGEMLAASVVPFRRFMLRQTRQSDIQTFVELSRMPAPEAAEDLPTVTLMSAFVVSELRTAFQIGFALFLPFIVIDVVVAAVLMSMGMMMLPPAMVSLPFKLLLFVMVDGWSLVVQGLVHSFR